jgi:HK97 family phage prohead protease
MPEFRHYGVQGLEIRSAEETESGLIEVTGQVIVYERSYDVWDMWGQFRETIHYGAATPVLAREDLDVRFLFNHNGMPLARTAATCSLDLLDSPEGLNIRAFIDPGMSLANDLRIAMKRGLITQMSVGMEVDPAGDVWSGADDWGMENVRDIYRLANIFDTSAVTYPASPTTSIQLAERMWSGMPVESRERTRKLWQIAREGRAGRISQAESDVLLHTLERLHNVDTLGADEEVREAPNAADTAVAAAIQQAQHALQIALEAQAKDPDNGSDPDDKAVSDALNAAKEALDKAAHSQADDGSTDPEAAEAKAEEERDASPEVNADGTEGSAAPSTDPTTADDGTGLRASRSIDVEMDLMRLRRRPA